jgi:hypothetical protein
MNLIATGSSGLVCTLLDEESGVMRAGKFVGMSEGTTARFSEEDSPFVIEAVSACVHVVCCYCVCAVAFWLFPSSRFQPMPTFSLYIQNSIFVSDRSLTMALSCFSSEASNGSCIIIYFGVCQRECVVRYHVLVFGWMDGWNRIELRS